MTNQTGAIGNSAFIYQGIVRVRWMRHDGEFPARVFLEKYPDDFMRFLNRAKEMATTGTIRLHKNGHPLEGQYSELHQFNMELTRSWGFRAENVYVVVHAAKKRTTGQEPDYERALTRREDYLTRTPDDC